MCGIAADEAAAACLPSSTPPPAGHPRHEHCGWWVGQTRCGVGGAVCWRRRRVRLGTSASACHACVATPAGTHLQATWAAPPWLKRPTSRVSSGSVGWTAGTSAGSLQLHGPFHMLHASLDALASETGWENSQGSQLGLHSNQQHDACFPPSSTPRNPPGSHAHACSWPGHCGAGRCGGGGAAALPLLLQLRA